MDSDTILFLCRRTLETALLVSAPALVTAIVIGFITSLLQAVTSIRDMTLGVVLKLAGVAAAILISGAWMMHLTVNFTTEIFNHIQAMGR